MRGGQDGDAVMEEPVRNAVRKRLDEGLRAHAVPTFFQKLSEKD